MSAPRCIIFIHFHSFKHSYARFKSLQDLNFFNVTTSDDPILPDLLQSDDSVTVIATDHVLACLVAAARSVYSWDIVVSKARLQPRAATSY